MDEVLDERVDETTKVEREAFEDENNNDAWDRGENSWNYNDVLVRYNSDGDIVYAISFANLDNDDFTNFAQFVWNWAKPLAAEIAAPVVTFYGQTATAGATTTVSYTEATKWMDVAGNDALDVIRGDASLAESDFVIDKDNAKTYNLSVLGDDGKWYTYTLVQAAASGVAALTGDYVINGNELNLPDPAMRIQTYLNTFDKVDEWATIE